MRIELCNIQRERLFKVEVDPVNPTSLVNRPDGQGPQVKLHWDQAWDDQGSLQRCPVCSCRELFVRKDFPQIGGLVIVVIAAVVAAVMFATGHVIWGFVVLGSVALADTLIFPFVKRCLVCYRCRSEFHQLPIRRDYPGWDLATGEKYRTS